MSITGVIPQLRTTDLHASLRFYVDTLGFRIEFNYEDFYAGVRAGTQTFHLKQVDDPDPSIAWVEEGGHFHLYLQTEDLAAVVAGLKARGVPLVKDIHETPWNTREAVLRDDQGHTLYLGQPL
ncbi:VOC family protein [Pseudoxanthomonas beigongshangi]